MTAQILRLPRALGWGASAAIHGGAALFLIVGLPAPRPPEQPVIVPLEMMAPPAAPPSEASEAAQVMEVVETAAPAPTPTTAEPPPVEALTVPPDTVQAEPPPEAVQAEPETVQAVVPEDVQATPPEPETAPILEEEVPPPPPPAPPPPQLARPPSPPPPRPVPRREPRPSPPVAQPVTQAQEAPQAAAPAPSAPSAPAARRMSAPPASWTAYMFSRIQRAQRYPSGAQRRREEGNPMVRFSVRRDGTLVSAQLVRSSGYPELDEEAVAQVQRAAPFRPLPDDVSGDVLEISVPVRFHIR